MSSTITTRLDEDQDPDSAGVARSEPGGRAQRRAGAARRGPDPLADQVKELLPDELIDQLMAGAKSGEEITGQGGLLSQLTKRMVERAMEVEWRPARAFTARTRSRCEHTSASVRL